MSTKLGIIGGMGPLATAVFMEKVIDFTKAEKDSDHIYMEIINDPAIYDRTEYLLGKSSQNPAGRIREIREILEKRGCEVIAIPCNTAFGLYDEFAGNSKETVIHSIKETAFYLKENKIHTAGILATDGTIQTKLFQEELAKHGIENIIPDEDNQRLVMEMIYDEVKCGLPVSKDKMDKVAGHLFAQGAEVMALGCTELSMAKMQGIVSKGYLDTMDVVARKAVMLCGKKLRVEDVLF